MIVGNYLLEAGHYAIQLEDWTAAIADLQRATELLQTAERHDRAAAADLLRLFALGQRWQSAQPLPADEADYRAGLESHLTNFKSEATAVTATEWHARLVRQVDPLAAARTIDRTARESEMGRLRVVQWSTGGVGAIARS